MCVCQCVYLQSAAITKFVCVSMCVCRCIFISMSEERQLSVSTICMYLCHITFNASLHSPAIDSDYHDDLSASLLCFFAILHLSHCDAFSLPSLKPVIHAWLYTTTHTHTHTNGLRMCWHKDILPSAWVFSSKLRVRTELIASTY